MIINDKFVKYNFSSRKGTKIQYIVIHDTGNTGKGADANAHFNYFNTGDRQASAHYFVDDKQILRIIKDEDKSWAVGDGGGKHGITNANSLSVEMCINIDGDFNKTYDNTVQLTKYLMQKHNIPIDNVVRHYDASRKLCPNIFKDNNWAKWYKFKQDITYVDYTDYLTNIYKKILRREPDAEGLKYWNDKLNNGTSKGEFLANLTESKEFKDLR